MAAIVAEEFVKVQEGAEDADVLEKEFAPAFTAEDFVNLDKFQIYLKLMIDGVSSQPFSARTIPPLDKPANSSKEKIIENSRLSFARPRAEVEEDIIYWQKSFGGLMSDKEKIKAAEEREKAKALLAEEEPQGEDDYSARKPKEDKGDTVVQQRPPRSSRPLNDTRPQRQPREKYERKPRKPETHQPFNNLKSLLSDTGGEKKETFKEQLVPQKTEAKSKAKSNLPKKTKDATPENKSALKDALSSLLGDMTEKTEGKKQKPKSTPSQDSKPREKPVKVTKPERVKAPEEPKEIPEDELKKMLEVDEE